MCIFLYSFYTATVDIKYTRLTKYNRITWFKPRSAIAVFDFNYSMMYHIGIFQIYITIIILRYILVYEHIQPHKFILWRLFWRPISVNSNKDLAKNWITGVLKAYYIQSTDGVANPTHAWTGIEGLLLAAAAEDVLG